MRKSANVRKTVVHKLRKSAAQIFFQMQKSQICTVHNFPNAELFFSRVQLFLQVTSEKFTNHIKIIYTIKKFLSYKKYNSLKINYVV